MTVIKGTIVCYICNKPAKLDFYSWIPEKNAYGGVCKDCALLQRLAGNEVKKR